MRVAKGKEGDSGSSRGGVNFRVLDEAWHRLGDMPLVGLRVGCWGGSLCGGSSELIRQFGDRTSAGGEGGRGRVSAGGVFRCRRES